MNKIIFFILMNFVFNQDLISTKEFTFYKTNDIKEIDISKMIKKIDGLYEIQMIALNDLEFNIEKKVMIQQCELNISISSEKSKDDIKVKVCNGLFYFENNIIIDSTKPILTIHSNKYSHLSGSFVFWITGKHVYDNVGDINPKNNGILREWYDDGDLFVEYKYFNEKRHGIQKKWYKNGQLDIKYNYFNGRLNGEQKRWHENGQIKSIIFYDDDKLNGTYKEWYSNGQLKIFKTYDNDILKQIIESYSIEGQSNL